MPSSDPSTPPTPAPTDYPPPVPRASFQIIGGGAAQPPAPTGYTPGTDAQRIVLCRRCNGRGQFHRADTTTHPHSGEVLRARLHTVTCACCEGTGRMLQTTTYRPYHPTR